MSYQQEVFSFISSIVGQNNIIAIPVEFVRFTGDFNTAAILTQLIYWQGKGRDPDGWIYKSYTDWERETALNKKRANRAVNNLKKMELIETKVAKVEGNPTLHYKFNNQVFVDLFGAHLEAEKGKKGPKTPKTVVSYQRVLTKIPKEHFPKSPLGTNLPYTKITNKDYDNVPASLPPEPVAQEPKKNSSSSFSKSELITVLATLMALIPEQHRKPSVEKTIEKGLCAHTEDYIRLAILYAISKSNGNTTTKLKAYLGKTIEKNWHDGWQPEKQMNQAAIQKEFEQIPDKALKMLADAGNQFAIDEMVRRK